MAPPQRVERLDVLGGRRFLVYEGFGAEGGPPEQEQAALVAAFDAVHDELRGGSDVRGVCVLIEDPDVMRRHPDAIWAVSKFAYVGYTADGRQVRVRYFDGVPVAP